MAAKKQLILITAPFNCGFCKRAQNELPELCESKGWELIEFENEREFIRWVNMPLNSIV